MKRLHVDILRRDVAHAFKLWRCAATGAATGEALLACVNAVSALGDGETGDDRVHSALAVWRDRFMPSAHVALFTLEGDSARTVSASGSPCVVPLASRSLLELCLTHPTPATPPVPDGGVIIQRSHLHTHYNPAIDAPVAHAVQRLRSGSGSGTVSSLLLPCFAGDRDRRAILHVATVTTVTDGDRCQWPSPTTLLMLHHVARCIGGFTALRATVAHERSQVKRAKRALVAAHGDIRDAKAQIGEFKSMADGFTEALAVTRSDAEGRIADAVSAAASLQSELDAARANVDAVARLDEQALDAHVEALAVATHTLNLKDEQVAGLTRELAAAHGEAAALADTVSALSRGAVSDAIASRTTMTGGVGVAAVS